MAMHKGREVRCLDRVDHPYELVRDVLGSEAGRVLRAAARAATARAQDVHAALRVTIAGVQLGADIALQVGPVVERTRGAAGRPVTRLQVRWQAARVPPLFPRMLGTLAIYPIAAGMTRLDFHGRYWPPLGPLGRALDAVLGRRIAAASVRHFVADVAAHLRRTLDRRRAPGAAVHAP